EKLAMYLAAPGEPAISGPVGNGNALRMSFNAPAAAFRAATVGTSRGSVTTGWRRRTPSYEVKKKVRRRPLYRPGNTTGPPATNPKSFCRMPGLGRLFRFAKKLFASKMLFRR